MDHQHFEEYLLNDTPVPREEKVAFEAHLKVCPKCVALHEANRALQHAVMAEPAPGFASRFQARLEARRKAERRRYFLGGLILFLSAVGLGLWFILPILPAAIFSPAALLTSWAQALASSILLIQGIVDASSVITRVMAGFIPNEAWIFMFGLFSLLVDLLRGNKNLSQQKSTHVNNYENFHAPRPMTLRVYFCILVQRVA